MFGSNKTISAYVGEHLASKELLEFVACSSHCQGLVIGQTLHKKHRQVRANADTRVPLLYNTMQVSFQAVDSGEQLHITGVQLSSDIYFFSQDIRVNPEVH